MAMKSEYAPFWRKFYKFLGYKPVHLSFIPHDKKIMRNLDKKRIYPYLKYHMHSPDVKHFIKHLKWGEKATLNGMRIFNTFTGLNPIEKGWKLQDVTHIYNILIDIDADTKHWYSRNALKWIVPITTKIRDFFDRSLADWKVTRTSDLGNQIVIPIKPFKLTPKKLDRFMVYTQSFYEFLHNKFSDHKRHIHIDQFIGDPCRVFRPPFTYNAKRGLRAFPVSKDWKRYEDADIWNQIKEIHEGAN